MFFSNWNDAALFFTNQSDHIRILPGSHAPVLTRAGIQIMRYGLVPHWSTTNTPKFATYNARIETVEKKPSWKIPFEKFHCIVPITGFVEPIYENYWAGHMVEFFGTSILYAAGVYDQWVDQSNGEVLESFAILMDQPNEYISSIGHDRMPIFLKKEDAICWKNSIFPSSKEAKSFLLKHKMDPLLDTRIDRPLKQGWQKNKNL
ncbi:MAG: SOS response-associated peptidase [Oligoflexia bacterium]|nr:SOS response-associated peptidase [Oligoflexia bacterium]